MNQREKSCRRRLWMMDISFQSSKQFLFVMEKRRKCFSLSLPLIICVRQNKQKPRVRLLSPGWRNNYRIRSNNCLPLLSYNNTAISTLFFMVFKCMYFYIVAWFERMFLSPLVVLCALFFVSVGCIEKRRSFYDFNIYIYQWSYVYNRLIIGGDSEQDFEPRMLKQRNSLCWKRMKATIVTLHYQFSKTKRTNCSRFEHQKRQQRWRRRRKTKRKK